MKKEEIIEGNKLIAEFMGLKLNAREYPKTPYYELHTQFVAYVDNLKYHLDWNWIMAVIEKIESLGYTSCIEQLMSNEYRVFFSQVNSGGTRHEHKLTCVWLEVVNFIKWRNETLYK